MNVQNLLLLVEEVYQHHQYGIKVFTYIRRPFKLPKEKFQDGLAFTTTGEEELISIATRSAYEYEYESYAHLMGLYVKNTSKLHGKNGEWRRIQ